MVDRIGGNIRYYRDKLNMTQATLEELVGIPDRRLCLYENGHRNLPIDLVVPLTEALNIEPNDLFRGTKKLTEKDVIRGRINAAVMDVLKDYELEQSSIEEEEK